MKKLSVLQNTGILLIFLFLIILSSCDSRLHNAKTKPLIVGTNVWPGYEPMYLARDLGFFNDNDIRLVEYSSATQVIRAFRNEIIDAASLTLDEALKLLNNGFNIKVVLIHDISNGGDVILSVPSIKKVKSLAGKRVGVESMALGAYVLSRALEINSVDLSNVKILPIEIDEHESAFKNKQVDAIVTFEPVRTKLLNLGANQIFDSSMIPGEIVDVLIIRDGLSNAKIDKVALLVKNWFKTLEYIDQNQQVAYGKIGKRLGLSSDDVRDSYGGLILPNINMNLEMMSGQDKGLITTAMKLEKSLYSFGLINERLVFDDFFESAFVEQNLSSLENKQ